MNFLNQKVSAENDSCHQNLKMNIMRNITLYTSFLFWIISSAMLQAQDRKVERNVVVDGTQVELDLNLKETKQTNDKDRIIYDYRTRIGVYIAGGLTDLVGGEDSYGNSPISALKSTSTEIGINWKTRLFEESNFMRIKYGVSFQWNKIAPRGNKYLVDSDGLNTWEEFPLELDKSLVRFTNVVVPVYLEFGPSKQIDDNNYISFSESRMFKIGLGGYAGINIESMQKLKYEENGIKEKHKIKRNYNTTDFVYGVGAYIGYDVFSLFAKYDLSPLFENQLEDKHLLTLGLRIDLE
jgi:hypothetical protein